MARDFLWIDSLIQYLSIGMFLAASANMNQVMECHHLKIGEAFLEITPIDLTQK
jgi:hypothetical protein